MGKYATIWRSLIPHPNSSLLTNSISNNINNSYMVGMLIMLLIHQPSNNTSINTNNTNTNSNSSNTNNSNSSNNHQPQHPPIHSHSMMIYSLAPTNPSTSLKKLKVIK